MEAHIIKADCPHQDCFQTLTSGPRSVNVGIEANADAAEIAGAPDLSILESNGPRVGSDDPPVTSSAQIRRRIAANTRRVRWPSATRPVRFGAVARLVSGRSCSWARARIAVSGRARRCSLRGVVPRLVEVQVLSAAPFLIRLFAVCFGLRVSTLRRTISRLRSSSISFCVRR
jgi:hypothetical protein